MGTDGDALHLPFFIYELPPHRPCPGVSHRIPHLPKMDGTPPVVQCSLSEYPLADILTTHQHSTS